MMSGGKRWRVKEMVCILTSYTDEAIEVIPVNVTMPMRGYTSWGVGACVIPFRAFFPGEVVLVTLRRGPDGMTMGS